MQWEQFRCNVDCKNYPKDCISEQLFVDMIDRLADDGWLEYGYDVLVLFFPLFLDDQH